MSSNKIILSLFIFLAGFASTLTAETIIYVDHDAHGADNGTSWDDAYLELSDALRAALPGTTLRVAEGSYYPGRGKYETFQLISGVILEGGYGGHGEPNPDYRDIQRYETVLDGCQRNRHVVNGSGTDETAVIDGFTIKRGAALKPGNDVSGGGMYIKLGSPTVSNCTFGLNHAENGGGMFLDQSHSQLIDCTFIYNNATSGGGLYLKESDVTVNRCTFTLNLAYQGAGVFQDLGVSTLTQCNLNGNTATYGGGLYNIDARVFLSDCEVYDNLAHLYGGGIFNKRVDHLTMTGCSIRSNRAIRGAGISDRESSESYLDNCLFQKNSGENGCGLYSYKSMNLSLNNCTFRENQAGGSGGSGMQAINSQATLTQCLFQDNTTTRYGGGMRIYSGTLTLLDCAFVGNSAKYSGGGLFNSSLDSQSLITRCLFSNNSSGIGGGGIYTVSSELSVSHCTFRENTTNHDGGGMHNFEANPLVSNCLFLKNRAQLKGGGLFNSEANTPSLVTNCTFIKNTADEKGGGLRNYKSNSVVHNCILWGNTPDQISRNGSPDMITTYNCIQDGFEGEGNIATDPMFLDPENDDYHLTWLSPCINRGLGEGAPTHDWDGDLRPNMGSVDMGIDEFTGTHALAANSFTLSQSQGGSISFDLQAETTHAGHGYVLLGGMSGTAPGQPLPGSETVLPINSDGFTEMMLGKLNSPLLTHFADLLQGSGSGTASLNIPGNLIPLDWLGRKMHFAFAVDTYDFVSNPVEVEIVP